MGIDPLTYNYRINELVAETFTDWNMFISIMKREIQIVKECGFFNTNAILRKRKEILTTQNVNMKVSLYCCYLISY